MKYFLMIFAVLALNACQYKDVIREIGYKGKARTNPWLAAERFAALSDGEVRSLPSWVAPEYEDAVWFIPAAILSNISMTRQMEDWVEDGGHLVVLIENAASETNDWPGRRSEFMPQPALIQMLERAGIVFDAREGASKPVESEKILLEEIIYKVDAASQVSVAAKGEEAGVFASVLVGDGRISVLTDGRLFRNRWIGNEEHAELLEALIVVTEYEGRIAFMRGSSQSLWGLLGEYLGPVLISLAVLLGLWLWKNFLRFGPLESDAEMRPHRGYDHHLEAIGNFQWRLDRAEGMLAPLRAAIFEKGQHMAQRMGRRSDDFYDFLAERSELPRERVQRALTENSHKDAGGLTRTTADLQRLLQFLH